MPENIAQRFQFVLIALVIGFFLVITWQTAVWTEQASLNQMQEKAGHNLRLYASNLRGELAKYQRLPQVLASNDNLPLMLLYTDDKVAVDSINVYLEKMNALAGASDTYVLDAKGLTIAASNWKDKKTFVGKNFAYRPYFQQAMEGKEGRYFALGTTSNLRGYYFSYPVRHSGNIVGAVVVKVTLSVIESAWAGADDEFIVTDPDGVIFITTNPAWKFRTLAPLSEADMLRLVVSRRYGSQPLKPLPVIDSKDLSGGNLHVSMRETKSGEGVAGLVRTDYIVQGLDMPEAGWRIHILSKVKPVQGQVLRAMVLVGVVYALVIVLVLFLRQRRKTRKQRMRYEEEAKRTLQANEERVQAIIDNTRAGLVTMDDEGLIESFNRTARAMFDIENSLYIGANFNEIIHPDNHAEVVDLIISPGSAKGSDEHSLEVLAKRRDGSLFPVELSVGELLLKDGHKLIATIHDITERKQSEEALQRAHDQLEHRVQERTSDLVHTNQRLVDEVNERKRAEESLRLAQHELIQAAKLAGLGQMSAGINHELNQPLTAIRSYAENAQTFIEHNRVSEASDNLGQISDLTERMAQIISQLKMFARKTSGQMVPVSVHAVLDRALTLLRQQLLSRGVEVELEMPDQELIVQADMVRLEQVFVNLVGNAMEAMEACSKPKLKIKAWGDKEQVRIDFQDSGPGIPEKHIEQIFDPFFTTKEVGQGLGLGLSISYRIIEDFSGSLRAENAQQGGAVFSLHLESSQTAERMHG